MYYANLTLKEASNFSLNFNRTSWELGLKPEPEYEFTLKLLGV